MSDRIDPIQEQTFPVPHQTKVEEAAAEPTVTDVNTTAQGKEDLLLTATKNEPSKPYEKIVTTLPVDHRGSSIYLKGWRQRNKRKSPILFVHDLGENTDGYRSAALACAKAGYSAYAFDLRGHGRSGRRLGHAPSFNILVSDLLQVVAWVRHLESGCSPVLVGQGIGALIVLEFNIRHRKFCKAAVLSAPCLKLRTKVKLPGRLFIKYLADLAPTSRLPSAMIPRFTRSLKWEQKQTAEDHKSSYFPRLTAIFAHEVLTAISNSLTAFKAWTGPVLILLPSNDGISDHAELRRAALIHSEEDMTVTNLEGVSHRVFTSSVEARKIALKTILEWLDTHAGAAAGPKESETSDSVSSSSRGKNSKTVDQPATIEEIVGGETPIK